MGNGTALRVSTRAHPRLYRRFSWRNKLILDLSTAAGFTLRTVTVTKLARAAGVSRGTRLTQLGEEMERLRGQ